MVIDGIEYDLEDDGTMDTVISVYRERDAAGRFLPENLREETIRFCTESAHGYRSDDGGFYDEGFRRFCEDVVAPTLDY